jgi:hypothetical protein
MDQQPSSPSSFNNPSQVSEAAPENSIWAADANVNFEEFTDMADEQYYAEADEVADIDHQVHDDEPVHLALSPRITPLDDGFREYEAQEEPVEMALSPSVTFLAEDMEQIDDEPVECALSPPASFDEEIMHCQVSYPMPEYASQPQFFEQAFPLDETANHYQNPVETINHDFSGMALNGCWPQHQTFQADAFFESQNIQPRVEELYSPVSDNGDVVQYGHSQLVSPLQMPSNPGPFMEQQQQQQVQAVSLDQLQFPTQYAQYNPNAATRPPMIIQNFFQASTINVSLNN